MSRIRVQKPKKVRRRGTPLEEIARSSSAGSQLVMRLEQILLEIDRALETVRD